MKFRRIENVILIVAFVLLGLGIVTMVGYLTLLSRDYAIPRSGVEVATTGQVGDFIGGVVGSIWGLTGVLLFYLALRLQTRELALQRDEVSLTRSEFRSERVATVTYEQLERIDKAIEALLVIDSEECVVGDDPTTTTKRRYRGLNAIVYLNRIIEYYESPPDLEKGQDKLLKFAQDIRSNCLTIVFYEEALLPLVSGLSTAVLAHREYLRNERYDTKLRKEYSKLLFGNVSEQLILLARKISFSIDFDRMLPDSLQTKYPILGIYKTYLDHVHKYYEQKYQDETT